ncbi:hypothetical protein [Roseicella sp. DB1501]|uniref:hypothetical protein n=1 Tax=Roseicella sp. DB1501 TaxID=2730925 RepID=UPI00149189BC|nr:hypothetical protein [Roseicella sp. DB1501]NOG70450.1 hypothetical protein [Roseicella sp. DB1501]
MDNRHTPGPVFVVKHPGGGWSIQDRDGGVGRCIAMRYGDSSEDNARLLAASYNAFDAAASRLNLNAVELAERMQSGMLADLLKALEDLHGSAPEVQGGICQHCGRDYIGDDSMALSGDCPSDDCPAHIARVLAAEVRGTV